jgi:glycosyltransferase involved in cell wall biosynthesis
MSSDRRDGLSAILSIFNIHPNRIDGTAMFARALSMEMGARGIRSILCFPSEPSPAVHSFLSAPNVSIEAQPEVFEPGFSVSSRAFDRMLRKHGPDIVHLHFMGFISLLPWLARKRGVRRIFFTDHSSRPQNGSARPRSLMKRLATRAINHPIDGIVAVSEYSLQSSLQLKQGLPERFRVIRNAIDLERVAAAARVGNDFRQRFGVPPDSPLITQVSWLIPEKGAMDLLEAAKTVIEACPKAHFLFAGAGPCLDEYKAMAAESGIGAQCTFTGQLADPFFDGVFSASDVICQPSRWQEAFCWVVAEAMAFGKPVVATRSGALQEIIRDQVTGFLVGHGSPGELGKRLTDLASDPALRERMGAAGKKVIAEEYSLNRNMREHLQMYGIDSLRP